MASLQQLMNNNKKKNSSQGRTNSYKYRKYDHKKRLKLIEMVEQEKKSLASSAKTLGIAQTTARLIMKTWTEEGRVFEKKVDRIKREKKEALRQSQARRKEREERRKQARKRPSNFQTSQDPQPQNEVQQNAPLTLEEPKVPLLAQIPSVTYPFNPWVFQHPFSFVYPPQYFY